ncbi:MAG TPA: pyridoxamine 5'-phosphate oxidase [Actinobacteria bacterium]|jgi:pyridoxamine 5'-phosphate oxidase|nr:pyridoxamine 5'-phosphate oxidase [Actinomycetota bacterium]
MSLWTPPPEDAPRRLADLRVSYDAGTLEEQDLASTPLAQFGAWLEEALDVGLPEPNAMVVATAGAEGQPSARTVLLKEADARGFVFYTNYGSRKSGELEENPAASCVFPWFAMHRQVVVVGRVERVSREEADAYFQSRPHGSRLGAWASRQSTVIEGRAGIEAEYARLAEQYPEESHIPIPDFWGGWLIRPVSVEFWQGRESRLHDRLRFVAVQGDSALDDPDAWRVERLSP